MGILVLFGMFVIAFCHTFVRILISRRSNFHIVNSSSTYDMRSGGGSRFPLSGCILYVSLSSAEGQCMFFFVGSPGGEGIFLLEVEVFRVSQYVVGVYKKGQENF